MSNETITKDMLIGTIVTKSLTRILCKPPK